MVWASLCIFLPLVGLTETFPTKVDSQNAHKMPNLKYPLSKENGVSFYNERHPLLKRCFQPFLKCMRQMGGASLCILLPFMGLTELCFAKVDCQIAQNTRGCWGYTLSVPKWLVILKGETYITNMRCFKPILRCMRPMGGALNRIRLSIIGSTEPFSTKVSSQVARQMPHFEYPLSTNNTYIMGCWTARRDINCLWSVSKPSLDALSRWEELPCASARHLWVSPSYVPQRLTLRLLSKCKFGVSSQYAKLGAELWGETSIAYELFQNLP